MPVYLSVMNKEEKALLEKIVLDFYLIFMYTCTRFKSESCLNYKNTMFVMEALRA